MSTIDRVLKVFILIAFIIGLGGGGYISYRYFDSRLALLDGKVRELSASQAALLSELSGTGGPELAALTQEDALTAAVADVAPSVVSIAVTKDMPQLEVVYIDPFGDGSSDSGIRLPRYRQRGTSEQQVAAGSGFIVDSKGYILTNRHLLQEDDARYTVLLSDGRQQAAEVVYSDPDLDIAILKVAGDSYPAISLGDSSALKVGQSVFAIGNALGEYSNSVSVGIVSGLDRNLSAFGGRSPELLTGVIQTDAAINPGNSGGPLVDLNGQVVGINVAMATAQNIAFAIPIDDVKPIIAEHAR